MNQAKQAASLVDPSAEGGRGALAVYPLSADAVAIAWDESVDQPDPFRVECDGKPLERGRLSLRLEPKRGGVRRICAFRLPAAPSEELAVWRSAQLVGRCRLSAQSADPRRLLQDLDDAGRARLLVFLLGTCRGLLHLGTNPEFVFLCRRFVRSCVATELAVFSAETWLVGGYAVYAGAVSCDIGPFEGFYLLNHRSVSESPVRPATEEGGGGRVLVALPGTLPGTGLLAVLVGKRGTVLARAVPAPQLPTLVGQAEAGKLTAACRTYALRCLGRLHEAPDAGAVARALQIFAPLPTRDCQAPRSPLRAELELSIGCGRAGIFARGWVQDLHQLLSFAEFQSPFGEARLSDLWRRLARPDLAGPESRADERRGFVALLPIDEPIDILQHRVRLHTAGGSIDVVPPARVLTAREARDQVLASVGPGDLDDALLDRVLVPAVRTLQQRVMTRRTLEDVVEIGPRRVNPIVSIVVPLYRNLEFLRLQIAAWSCDVELRRDSEIIFVLDSPEQRDELVHYLWGQHALSGLAFRIVVMGDNFGFAAATNAGARLAAGRLLMLLNSDVVPLREGWLGVLRAALDGSGAAMVGPKLLFDDGSLQHAGLTFERDFEGRWYNTHFYKGYPRDWPAANLRRSVPGVTGAAMLLTRALYEDVGGFSEDYVIGDYEDSDLCLKVRARGHDIVYEPKAELYHFERRSIQLHEGYAKTMATAYNRRLHAERWSDVMESLTR